MRRRYHGIIYLFYFFGAVLELVTANFNACTCSSVAQSQSANSQNLRFIPAKCIGPVLLFKSSSAYGH